MLPFKLEIEMDFSSSLKDNLLTLKRAAGDSLKRAKTLMFSSFIGGCEGRSARPII